MDRTQAQAVNNLLQWALRLARPDGAPVSDDRFCEAALLLSRHARRALPEGLGPEQIALPQLFGPSRKHTAGPAKARPITPAEPDVF